MHLLVLEQMIPLQFRLFQIGSNRVLIAPQPALSQRDTHQDQKKINGTPGKPAVYIYVKISPMHFRTILDSELDDFETKCRIAKINPQEFQLHEHDIVETPLNNGLFIAKLTITKQNVKKTYVTGKDTHWVADFADDLEKGVFNYSQKENPLVHFAMQRSRPC